MKLRRILVYGFLATIFFILLALVIVITNAKDIPIINDFSDWIYTHVKVGETSYTQLQQTLFGGLSDLQCKTETTESPRLNSDDNMNNNTVECISQIYRTFNGPNVIDSFINYMFTISFYSVEFQFQNDLLFDVEIRLMRAGV